MMKRFFTTSTFLLRHLYSCSPRSGLCVHILVRAEGHLAKSYTSPEQQVVFALTSINFHGIYMEQ